MLLYYRILSYRHTAGIVSIFGVILVSIQSECGKIRTGITSNTDTFYAVPTSRFFPIFDILSNATSQVFRTDLAVSYFHSFIWLKSLVIARFKDTYCKILETAHFKVYLQFLKLRQNNQFISFAA